MGHPFFDLRPPVVIGHRGCAGEVPENTLASFEAALGAGAAILETDLHLTRDGVPVLIHDPAVDRTTDGRGRVADRTLEELRQLDAGYRFEAGGTHPFRGRGLRVPSLGEALARFPTARFNLELKLEAAALVERTVETLAAAGAAERTLLTAASPELMGELRRWLARHPLPVALGASAAEVLAFVRAALDDAPPPEEPMALQVPAFYDGRPLVTERFVAHAHRHGLAVHVWTINDPSEMQRLLDLGVDGIVTDYPGRLASLVESRRRVR